MFNGLVRVVVQKFRVHALQRNWCVLCRCPLCYTLKCMCWIFCAGCRKRHVLGMPGDHRTGLSVVGLMLRSNLDMNAYNLRPGKPSMGETWQPSLGGRCMRLNNWSAFTLSRLLKTSTWQDEEIIFPLRLRSPHLQVKCIKVSGGMLGGTTAQPAPVSSLWLWPVTNAGQA